MSKKMLVTNALPYANGSLHLGHILEAIQTDIWVRYHRGTGHETYYVCADDAHGAPIMLHARKLGITPQALIEQVAQEHKANFAAFYISFDHYHTTDSDENRQLVETVYLKNRAAGHIATRLITQAYDPQEHMFLPDRYVKGECPRCGASDQYGDNCEKCSATYTPVELKNPYSVLSGATPVKKESLHYFFKLTDFEPMLRKWSQESGSVQAEVSRKLAEWFEAGLRDWDISRDSPYFGFKIPDTEDKYFYVWLDAPIGYMASFKVLCDKNGLDFDEFWSSESNTELYHFIGKDITYFHTLFWPALLEGAGYRKPTAIFTHGFLNANGEKMSKSRGTFINANNYLDHLDPEYLRYYFAAKLGSGIHDIDFNLSDFLQRVNSDLIGKYINIASRCASFISKRFDNTLSLTCTEPELLASFVEAGKFLGECYEKREYGQAVREIMALADRANQYIDEKKPWIIAKEAGQDQVLHEICSVGINLFRLLTIYLQPVLPETARKVCEYLNLDALEWHHRAQPLVGHTVNDFSPLMKRVEAVQVEAMLESAGRNG
ncbi:methionine--tRNA ligase [Cupriavidus sp.]|uniref:methionine--tRNA ligase n=1 Tax=unclassified Cupriavidus TaxID=2640874 RepID=UPI001C006927|nr:methionine--tRNA ligase [Cupriavidus sp.]QWE96931.1 methionine--tRNA ligase [Cupriavidus sp. EM10]MCA3191969.1 methionine--tRNA ligase [Cupriavidus sp.]MCA3197714.1 methionine--tRNA ligase [Cupriavidus sp.]MCA3202766.1 methionine--tRNA ligase [Cupriavidus sp.]MCA3207936.1 methionine--tRNA ligase [Cupriavidus sp.]